ncbi:MAG: thioredoxin family protein [Phycisphaerales bacterium]|nr:thioredoxin family protein [Phycisphaerales bacterium]
MPIFQPILVAAALLAFASTVSAQTPAPSAQPTERKPLVPVAKKPVYDESADARKQIAAALAAAKRDHTRVLIQWGGNWCPWCIRMDDLMKSDKAISKEMRYEYQLIHVDCGRPNGKNMDLAATYGASAMKDEGFPFLTVLDENGKPVANTGTRRLELNPETGHVASLKAGHDPKAVLKFLQDQKAPATAAKPLLDAALAKAKGEGKSVFLHFGAPWCGWCHRLEGWMARPEVASILAKDFVDVKIDTDRFTGGSDMLKRYRPTEDGIPWFVFLDGSGTVVVDSTGPKGNTGFPSAPEELAHFEQMLKKARKNMTDAEIASLMESLKNDKPAGGH